jgi:hypothetical protein
MLHSKELRERFKKNDVLVYSLYDRCITGQLASIDEANCVIKITNASVIADDIYTHDGTVTIKFSEVLFCKPKELN